MRRTAEDAAKTRLALQEAALMSFEEKGWRGATFEHVAERAGVTRGALHHHFRSKEALLVEALEWGWSEYESKLFAEPPTGPAQEWLSNLLSQFVTMLINDALFRALASATVLVAPQALENSTAHKHDALDSWHERLSSALRGTRTRLPHTTVAGIVLVMLQGFTVTAVTRPQDLPHPPDLDAALAATVRGLLA